MLHTLSMAKVSVFSGRALRQSARAWLVLRSSQRAASPTPNASSLAFLASVSTAHGLVAVPLLKVINSKMNEARRKAEV